MQILFLIETVLLNCSMQCGDTNIFSNMAALTFYKHTSPLHLWTNTMLIWCNVTNYQVSLSSSSKQQQVTDTGHMEVKGLS